MKILLTAFEPFGGDSINPAQETVAMVKDQIAGTDIVKLTTVPVVFHKAIATVRAAMAKEQPDVTLCIGQAGGRLAITPERIAINVDDARIPDNEGNQPLDVPVFADGEAAYFSNLPVKAMVKSIQEAGVPASLSNTAGTFVCNHLMYGVLYHIARSFPQMRGGFIHVPFLHEQAIGRADTASLSKEDIVRGIEAALEAIVTHQADITAVMGTTH